MVSIINLLSKQSDYSIEKVANNTVNVGELEQTSLDVCYLSYEVLHLIVAPKLNSCKKTSIFSMFLLGAFGNSPYRIL